MNFSELKSAMVKEGRLSAKLNRARNPDNNGWFDQYVNRNTALSNTEKLELAQAFTTGWDIFAEARERYNEESRRHNAEVIQAYQEAMSIRPKA